MSVPRDLDQRFWDKVDVQDWQDCWPWTATAGRGKGGKPYGQFRMGSRTDGTQRMVSAHRLAYELLVGPIPAGLTIDHVHDWGCTSTLCCNPLHLEAVTIGENVRRLHSRQTHCRLGHPLVAGISQRFCRVCATEASRRWRGRQRDA